MLATWVAGLLLVVGQIGDDMPQRLPPVPGEVFSTASTFLPNNTNTPSGFVAPTNFTPDGYHPEAGAPPQFWSPAVAPSTEPVGLPPPPEFTGPSFSEPGIGEPVLGEALFAEEIPLPGTRLTFTTLGWGSGFETTSFDFNHTWLAGYGDGPPVNITPGFGLHFWSDTVGLGLPPRVYDLYVDFQWTPIQNERWGVNVGLTPGFYGDYAQLGGETFQLTGWIVGNWQLEPHWQLLLGVAYVRQLQSNLVPVGGVIWTPSEDIRLELVIPKPKYAVRFRETTEGSLWWYIGGQLGGGAWAVADTPGNSALVSYNDLRLIFGIESYRLSGHEWSLELGYVFDRNLYIDNQHVVSPDGTLSLSASLAY